MPHPIPGDAAPRVLLFYFCCHTFISVRRKFLPHLSVLLVVKFSPFVFCEGGGDVVGVVTPLVGGVAQAFHDDQVVELRVQLGVQEVEGKEEDRKGQVEVEEERRLKEVRSWMTMEMLMTRLRS